MALRARSAATQKWTAASLLAQALRERSHSVRDRFQESRFALYREYGIQVHAETEHNACLAALHATRDAALREIDVESASVIAGLQASITALKNSDVTGLPTLEEPPIRSAAKALRSHPRRSERVLEVCSPLILKLV